MKRRELLTGSAAGVLAGAAGAPAAQQRIARPKDYRKEPFKRLVILGESTVEGGRWLRRREDRYADVLVNLINACQEQPIEYFNKGIGANAISPRSPGYEGSRKPSAMERYKTDVIELKPDLFVLAYGLNDMRARMPIKDFCEDMATIIRDVKKACSPLTVLTTVYHMTAWRSFPPTHQGSEELTLEYNKCIASLAAEFDCVLADVWAAEGLADWLICLDGVHANKVGNIVIASRIFEAIATHASGLTVLAHKKDFETEWAAEMLKKRESFGDPFKKTW